MAKPERFMCCCVDASQVEKEAAGRSIADLVDDGMVVGLGTGTTAAQAIIHLGTRIAHEGLSVLGIPTSYQSMLLAVRHRVPLTSLYEHDTIDIALDGADQVDGRLNLIKGGGGAHTREKIVARAARRFYVAVDGSKLAPRLTLPVPLEVLHFACPLVRRCVRQMGASAKLRRYAQNGTYLTDEGNLVLDAHFGTIANPKKLSGELSAIVGVVEHGIFTDVSEVHVARLSEETASVEILKP